MKNLFVPMLALMMASVPSAAAQGRQAPPPLDDSDRPKIDVESYVVDITLEPDSQRLIGRADIRFKQLDRKTYAVFDIDRRLRIVSASIGGADVRFRQFDIDSTVEIELSNQQFNADPVLHIEYAGILNPEEERREPILARVSEESAFLLYARSCRAISDL